MLEICGGIDIVGEARHGREALERIEATDPDLVFLDVRMPELDGLAVLRSLQAAGRVPGIIFVTAYDRYAVAAFEHHAIDYLLKPFDEERVRVAVDRARQRLDAGTPDALADRVAELLEELKPGPRERIAVRTGTRTVLVDPGDVEWIESADNYVRLHTGTGQHLLRGSLAATAQTLDETRFVRIHRSAIVNLEHVAELRSRPSGDGVVRLHSGTELPLSRRYRDAFEKRLGAT
jgi:two-component system LytT family response regulator